jgi:hypothetical protein
MAGDKFSELVQFKETSDVKELIGVLANDLDVSPSELIRTCIRLGLPLVKAHPSMLGIITIEAVHASKH